jgi:hypothetical protein
MGTTTAIDLEATGHEAALQAMRALWAALVMLNATDLGDRTIKGDRPVGLTERLANDGPGTPYRLTKDALLGTLDVYLGKGREYSQRVYWVAVDTGEGIAWAIEKVRRDDVELAAEDAADRAPEPD